MKQTSFMTKFKQFFDDRPIDENLLIFNEASISAPVSTKNSNQKTNQTLPVYSAVQQAKNVFEIDEDNLEHIYSTEDAVKQPQSQVQERVQDDQLIDISVEGYQEIEVKPLKNNPSLAPFKPTEEPYKKLQIINFPPSSTFQIAKIPKKFDRFMEYLKGYTTRFLLVDGGFLYELLSEGKNDEFKVKNMVPLDHLFKIYIKDNEKKPLIKLAFINDKRNIHLRPRVKDFKLENKEQQNLFFIKLRSEIQKYGLDLLIQK